MKNKFTRFLFFFLVFLILLQLFGKNDSKNTNPSDDVVISSKSKMVIGKEVILDVRNRSEKAISIPVPCPANPLKVEYYQNGEWAEKTVQIDEKECEEKEKSIEIEAEKSVKIGFGLWNHDLFDQIGKYRITYATVIDEKEKNYFHEIEITEPSFIRRGWNTLLYKPIFNTLIYLIDKLPGHSLGWAIILLTLIIKLILLVPNQKALRSQKMLQKVQPQLDALKQKYKNDPQRLARETMALWKKYKVSPMGSCLPMLIQFPILIALFYVVKGGLDVIDTSLLYEPLRNFDISSIEPIFLGIIDLTKINLIVLPVIIGGLQFFQIRLSLNKNKGLVKKTEGAAAVMPMMNNMMQYFMPVMIAVFSASLPAAVGFYWGISTLFGIGQQLVVNNSKN